MKYFTWVHSRLAEHRKKIKINIYPFEFLSIVFNLLFLLLCCGRLAISLSGQTQKRECSKQHYLNLITFPITELKADVFVLSLPRQRYQCYKTEDTVRLLKVSRQMCTSRQLRDKKKSQFQMKLSAFVVYLFLWFIKESKLSFITYFENLFESFLRTERGQM